MCISVGIVPVFQEPLLPYVVMRKSLPMAPSLWVSQLHSEWGNFYAISSLLPPRPTYKMIWNIWCVLSLMPPAIASLKTDLGTRKPRKVEHFWLATMASYTPLETITKLAFLHTILMR